MRQTKWKEGSRFYENFRNEHLFTSYFVPLTSNLVFRSSCLVLVFAEFTAECS